MMLLAMLAMLAVMMRMMMTVVSSATSTHVGGTVPHPGSRATVNVPATPRCPW